MGRGGGDGAGRGEEVPDQVLLGEGALDARLAVFGPHRPPPPPLRREAVPHPHPIPATRTPRHPHIIQPLQRKGREDGGLPGGGGRGEGGES